MIYLIIFLYLLIGEGVHGCLEECRFYVNQDRLDHPFMVVGWAPFMIVSGIYCLCRSIK